jgi:hypothetical protein
MKKIRKFNEFFYSFPHEDGIEESPKGDVKCESFETFEEFSGYVKANPDIFNNVKWSLLPKYKESGRHFSMYVKPGCRFSVISDCSVTPCKVLGVVSCDGVVKHCMDQNDKPCEPGDLQEMLSQLGMTEKDL